SEPSRTIEISRIKKDRRHSDTSLQLLQQGESSVYGKQRTGAQYENDVAKEVRIIRHPCRHEINEGCVFGEHRMHSLHYRVCALLALRRAGPFRRRLRATDSDTEREKGWQARRELISEAEIPGGNSCPAGVPTRRA